MRTAEAPCGSPTDQGNKTAGMTRKPRRPDSRRRIDREVKPRGIAKPERSVNKDSCRTSASCAPSGAPGQPTRTIITTERAANLPEAGGVLKCGTSRSDGSTGARKREQILAGVLLPLGILLPLGLLAYVKPCRSDERVISPARWAHKSIRSLFPGLNAHGASSTRLTALLTVAVFLGSLLGATPAASTPGRPPSWPSIRSRRL